MNNRIYIIKNRDEISDDLRNNAIGYGRLSKDRSKEILTFEDTSSIGDEQTYTHEEIREELNKDEWRNI
tara:strand:- start:1118 stop:1324 length:207 start_codon:yes stop_codon:yes gene_type:complete